ncbi:hypothetical protein_gp041 [Bacillus phage vB_BceM_WH1]|nr:hypothetical protein_gp041 [Bacillus phage vB_BceM_WH1]
MYHELGISISCEEWDAFDPLKKQRIVNWMMERYQIDLSYLQNTEIDYNYFYGDEDESNNS